MTFKIVVGRGPAWKNGDCGRLVLVAPVAPARRLARGRCSVTVRWTSDGQRSRDRGPCARGERRAGRSIARGACVGTKAPSPWCVCARPRATGSPPPVRVPGLSATSSPGGRLPRPTFRPDSGPPCGSTRPSLVSGPRTTARGLSAFGAQANFIPCVQGIWNFS